MKVLGAEVRGHLIRNQAGQVVGRVSATKNWLPLPPGSCSVEFKGVRRQVRLRAGQRVVFQ